MPEWFEEWFGEEYLQLYPHRDDAEADGRWRSSSEPRGSSRAGGCSTWAAARDATPERSGRSAPAAWDWTCRVTLLRVARGVTDAPLVRADMRRMPIRPGSMDLTVNLFTSFGYFEHDEEHAAALREMVATLRPGGWFVIDFLNAAEVRRRLVPRETSRSRAARPKWRARCRPTAGTCCKTIVTPAGRRFTERVRLFDQAQMSAMLARRRRRGPAPLRRLRRRAARPDSPRTILAGRTRMTLPLRPHATGQPRSCCRSRGTAVCTRRSRRPSCPSAGAGGRAGPAARSRARSR